MRKLTTQAMQDAYDRFCKLANVEAYLFWHFITQGGTNSYRHDLDGWYLTPETYDRVQLLHSAYGPAIVKAWKIKHADFYEFVARK